MEEVSLLKNKTWYWRQGFRRVPMNYYREYWLFETKELYTPVTDEDQASKVIEELRKAGIDAESKRTHSRHDVVPKGSLIVFAALSRASDRTKEEKIAEVKNIEKLKAYISSKGGMIGDGESPSTIKNFFLRLFGKQIKR